MLNEKAPVRTSRYLVSLLLVAASAGYVYWQDFVVSPGLDIRKRLHLNPAKLAAALPKKPALPEPVVSAPPPDTGKAEPAPVETSPQPARDNRPAPPHPAHARTATVAAAPAAAAPAATPLPAPEAAPAAAPVSAPHRLYAFADGDYTGDPAECEWGIVQVKVAIRSGEISDVKFLQVPDHRDRSAEISEWAAPELATEAIKEQNYDVDIVSSATFTSQAFQTTLYSALQQARK